MSLWTPQAAPPVAGGADPNAHNMRSSRPRPDARVADAGASSSSDERPSKSQRKRDAHALQELGQRLVDAPPDKVSALGLDDELLEAISLARRIRSHGARRRQVQLIGRLMRSADAEAIADALDEGGARHRAEVAQMHAAELWRTRLLSDADALAQWRARFGEGEAARQVEALLAPARAEQARGQPGRHYRDLYRCLRAALAPQDTSTPSHSEEP